MGLSDLWKHQHKDGEDGEVRPVVDIPSSLKHGLETPEDTMIGRVIAGRYQIESVLSKGGMGILYLAKHRNLPKKFAIKLIRMQGLSGRQREVYLGRFKREARAAAKVSHPNVVEIVDYNIIDSDTPYIVMEFVEGQPLSEFLKEYSDGLPIEWFFSLTKQLCRAMEAIHQSGMIHRDIKPSNIMVRHDSAELHLTILDFGLVHLMQNDLETNNVKLTAHGHMVGTPAYMSPEQCRGQNVSRMTDIYSLGLVAYEMLTAQPAVIGDDYLVIMGRQIKETPTPIQQFRPEIPDEVCRAIDRAISKRPEDRYTSARDFYKAIEIEQHQFTLGKTRGSGHAHRHLLTEESADVETVVMEAPQPSPAARWWWLVPLLLLPLVTGAAWLAGLLSFPSGLDETSWFETHFSETQTLPLAKKPLLQNGLALIPEKRLLALIYEDGSLEFHNIEKGNLVHKPATNNTRWLAHSVPAAGDFLGLLAQDQCRLALVDSDDFQITTFNLCELTKGEPVMDIAFSPRLDRREAEPDLVVLTSTQLLMLDWNGRDQFEILKSMPSEGRGRLVYDDKGSLLAHFAGDNQVRVYRMPEKGLILRETYSGAGQVQTAYFSEDGRYLVAGTRGNQVLTFDLFNKVKKANNSFDNWVRFCMLLPDPNRKNELQVLAYSQSGDFTVLQLDGLKKQEQFESQRNLSMAYSDGGVFALAKPDTGKVHIYRRLNRDILNETALLGGSVWDVATRGTKGQIVVAGLDPNIAVLSTDPPRSGARLEGHQNSVTRVSITKNGERMVSASDDFTLIHWDLDAGRMINRTRAHEDLVNNVVLSPDDTLCVSTSSDRTVKVWRLPQLSLEQSLAPMPDSSAGAAFNDDGSLLVIGDWSGNLRIYRTDGFQQQFTQRISTRGLYWISFFPGQNNRLLINTSDHQTLLVELHDNDVKTQILPNQSSAYGVTHGFSRWPDANSLAVFRGDRVQLYTSPGLQPIGNAIGLNGAHTGVFDPKLPRLYIGTNDGRLLTLDLTKWPRWQQVDAF
ncbi:serine/threonine-protein kinase [Acanthopleuribacter pedis]|uniref:Protein kinase n=1 Tax=Acanthopleuribacter pedis TaxID=442870 RepID=A0A8J7U428_9BACT|nr:serine/threonine-protein kinase [Acanthopleuribacter pedis]MBO1320207.1 protein kinase [Acanthopleuribacter pedis]